MDNVYVCILKEYCSVSVEDGWSGVELKRGRKSKFGDYYSQIKDNRIWSEIVSDVGMGRRWI